MELLKSFELIFQPEEGKKENIAPQYLPEELEGDTRMLFETEKNWG